MLTETLFKIPFSVIGRCSNADFSLAAGSRINLSQGASGRILHNRRRLTVCIFSVKIAAIGSLERVIGRISKIGK
jgi:hypothetical protein